MAVKTDQQALARFSASKSESPEAHNNSLTSWKDAPTHTLSAGGVEFAYRQLGPSTGVPVVFLTHLAAVLDNWDPRVVDGIAAEASGHHLRQPRCRCLQWVHADDHRGDGERRRHLHPCPRLRSGRPVRVLHGRHDRPGDRAGGAAARAQDDPRRNRPRGGRRHRQGDPHLLPRHRARTAHPPGPQAVPLLHQDSERAPSRRRSSWHGWRNARTTATRPSP